MNSYKDVLKFYPDFPLRGVNFVDIMPLIQNKALFRSLVSDLSRLCDAPNIVAPEARGFLFASPMLCADDKTENVIPVRKKGKLPYNPGDLVAVDIVKEYGLDQVYYRLSDIAAGKPEGDVFELSFFDDVLATGGTAKGIVESLESQKVTVGGKEYGIKVKDFVFLIEIDVLNGRRVLDGIAPVKSLIHV